MAKKVSLKATRVCPGLILATEADHNVQFACLKEVNCKWHAQDTRQVDDGNPILLFLLKVRGRKALRLHRQSLAIGLFGF